MPMFSETQTKFIQEQSKNYEGNKWLEILKTITEGLYNSRGISPDDIRPRQIAAQEIEKVISLMEVGSEKIKPALNNEYR